MYTLPVQHEAKRHGFKAYSGNVLAASWVIVYTKMRQVYTLR